VDLYELLLQLNFLKVFHGLSEVIEDEMELLDLHVIFLGHLVISGQHVIEVAVWHLPLPFQRRAGLVLVDSREGTEEHVGYQAKRLMLSQHHFLIRNVRQDQRKSFLLEEHLYHQTLLDHKTYHLVEHLFELWSLQLLEESLQRLESYEVSRWPMLIHFASLSDSFNDIRRFDFLLLVQILKGRFRLPPLFLESLRQVKLALPLP